MGFLNNVIDNRIKKEDVDISRDPQVWFPNVLSVFADAIADFKLINGVDVDIENETGRTLSGREYTKSHSLVVNRSGTELLRITANYEISNDSLSLSATNFPRMEADPMHFSRLDVIRDYITKAVIESNLGTTNQVMALHGLY